MVQYVSIYDDKVKIFFNNNFILFEDDMKELFIKELNELIKKMVEIKLNKIILESSN